MRTRDVLGGGIAAAATTAVVGYFLDPASGRRRRHEAADRGGRFARQLARRGARYRRRATSEAYGAMQGARHAGGLGARQPANLETLADRVRSEIFRERSIGHEGVNVSVEREGEVTLRGWVARSDDAEHLVGAARGVPGVDRVESHLRVRTPRAQGLTGTRTRGRWRPARVGVSSSEPARRLRGVAQW